MYTNNRDAYRQSFYDAWQKHLNHLPLEPLEQQMVQVMLHHPEYHALLSDQKRCLQEEFAIEDNPFFHLSLHLTIAEQLKLDRPKGITNIYQNLLSLGCKPHDALHLMINCLAQCLWQAQQHGQAPSEQAYLEQLRLIQPS